MLSAEEQPHPSAFVRQAPGRKSAVKLDGRLDEQRVSLRPAVAKYGRVPPHLSWLSRPAVAKQ